MKDAPRHSDSTQRGTPLDTPPDSPLGWRRLALVKGLGNWLLGRDGETTRDVLEDLIDEAEDGEASLGDNERQLLGNILDLKDQTIADVMVPRVDVIGAKASISLAGLVQLISDEGHSRVPLLRNGLDDAFAMVHVKDVVAWRGEDQAFDAEAISRPILFVAPSMQVLELLLEMRAKRTHMALVVDEYGGVDGLVTIEDLVEEIIGEIEDEFDSDDRPVLEQHDDGSWDADARTSLEDFETAVGRSVFSIDQHDDVDTLGGLVFGLAGRVPTRGELLCHDRNLEFEILDADPRRVKRVRLRFMPKKEAAD